MIYFVVEIKWGTDMVRIIKRELNLVPVGKSAPVQKTFVESFS